MIILSRREDFSSGTGEPVYVGGVGGEQGRDDAFTVGAQVVTVRFLNLDDQAMGPQQREQACDGGSLLVALLCIATVAVESVAQIAIAETVEEELAVGHG